MGGNVKEMRFQGVFKGGDPRRGGGDPRDPKFKDNDRTIYLDFISCNII